MAPETPLRPFGTTAADLELDFQAGARPALVTALLAHCSSAPLPAAEQHWWLEPVGRRTAALLRLLQATEARAGLGVLLTCPHCSERIEVELPLPALADAAPPAAGPLSLTLPDGRCVQGRLPTGDDLRRWQAGGDTAAARLLADLVDADALAAADPAQVAQALADADPLVGFEVQCRCPACDAAARHDVDLEGLALGQLAARQRALLHEVHVLASRYGWTEAEILAVAPARRARYIDLIEAEA